MEWKVLSIFVFIVIPFFSMQKAEKPNELSSSVIQNGKRIKRAASLVLCGIDQIFLCTNFTHYIPCTRIDKTNFSSLHETNHKAYDCGPGRCCRPGAPEPCSYECAFRSSDVVNLRFRWNVLKQKVHKQIMGLTEPLSSEEVDRQNKIVSIKNFIVRQKNVKDVIINWKPSYRMFCNVQLCAIQGTCSTKSTTVSVTSTARTTTQRTTTPTKTTEKPTTITAIKTTHKPTTTTTIKTTTPKTTHITTTHKSTTPKITTPKTTAHKTTTPKTTTRKTTTPKTTTPKTTTPKTTPRKTTTKQKLTTKTTHKLTTLDIYACSYQLRDQKKSTETSCRDYLQCELVSRNTYRWKFYSCKGNNLFDQKYQSCRNKKSVKCTDNKFRGKVRWRSFLKR